VIRATSLALVVALAAGCAGRRPEPVPVTVDASRNGTAMTLATGATLVVRLDANRTTGFAWTWSASTPGVLTAAGEPAYESAAAPAGTAGAGGAQVFSFTAAAPGTTTLRFAYARAWEKDVPPARTVTYDVTVK
jgi:inhibitor of cysteine peptidase